ncbi:hypothetical protein RUM44_004816 [Polyplax serrata]|uniref:CWF19-like protein 2 n=1 Tax=Polyplax serrata TaxID=468196 RepID=A0ABR1B3W8_POLSC
MGHKSSSKSKHRKKDRKEKRKSKHKKEKKSRKEERKRCRSYSSSTSSSGSDESVKESPKRQDWNFLETALSETKNASSRGQKTVKPREDVYEPRNNIRELNPYWRDNGTGLPMTSSTLKSKCQFLKPEEGHSPTISNQTYSNNWRRKNFKVNDIKGSSDTSRHLIKESEQKAGAQLSNADLNSLAAKLVKAEIMGNTTLVEKLKAELEVAKKEKSATASTSESQGKYKEVVIVTDGNSKGVKKPFEKNESQYGKRRKLDAKNEFLSDENKYSLKNLFVKEKTETQEEDIMRPGPKVTNLDELDDVYLDSANSEKSIRKREQRKEARTVQEAIKKHKTLEGCQWCIDNKNETKHLIVSTGSKCYLRLPEVKSLNDGHCIIVPIQHEASTRKLDEEIWEEINTYKKLLTRMFSEQGMDTIFFENARAFRHYPHCYIQCVPLDKESGDLAPIYFQKAISECETEWSNNKKVVDFRNKDFTKCIPKDLPYFAVSFGIEGGFAHIIEDEQLFPRNFAEEVIGGMLDLEPARWRKPAKEHISAQREKTLAFMKIWKKYEFNSNSCDSSSDSDSSG